MNNWGGVQMEKISVMFRSKDTNGVPIIPENIGDFMSISLDIKGNRIVSATGLIHVVDTNGCHRFEKKTLEIIQVNVE